MKLEPALSLERLSSPPPNPPVVSFFEFWPGWLFYTPIVLQWMALGLRYGDLSLPTAANPNIAVGGLCGESKRSILDQIAPEEQAVLARYTSIVTDPRNADADTDAAEQAMQAAALAYPVVAKPDIGCNGTGVRLVADRAGLARSMAAFPRNTCVLLQEYIPYDGEAGLFYIRRPGEARGQLTSVTLKFPPFVTGDGRSTMRELVLADPRAGRLAHLYLPRLGERQNDVPRQGEVVRLVFVGNHCKGSMFRDGASLATEALAERVDCLAKALPDFHFGRIDVRFESLPALARGEGFRVIEINGVGSEATHVWDPATSLMDAWRAQFYHYGAAFRIAAANRALGHRPAGLRAMWRHWQEQKRLMAAYPLND
jgi:hypothetical protein